MKKLLTLVTLVLMVSGQLWAQTTASAEEQLKTACAKAAKEDKKVLVMFTASWCGWCHKMKNSMADEDIRAYFEKSFVPLYIVVSETPNNKSLETPGGAEMQAKYGGTNQGIPFWLLFDGGGNLVADSMMPDGSPSGKINAGCPASQPEVDYFISVLQKTTKLSKDQLEKISKRFLKNNS